MICNEVCSADDNIRFYSANERRIEDVKRNFIYVYERIYKEAGAMKSEFAKIPVNGRQTSKSDQKRIKKIVSDAQYQIAQECSVIVSYPRMHIVGKEVVLGKPIIMLPDCRLVSIEELRRIETGG